MPAVDQYFYKQEETMETIKTFVVLFLYLLLSCNARVNIILDTDMVKRKTFSF